ncbi:hypothetical protein HY546_02605 [archaeon]|nr:hypothetical protein [archaeon]
MPKNLGMQHLTIGVFGDSGFLKRLGKPGTTNDLLIYNHADSQHVYTYVSPNSPDNKLQPLLQAAGMIDVPVIVANALTRELAEQIVLLDAFGFERGFIVSGSEDLRNAIRGTFVEKYEWVADEKDLAAKLAEVQPRPASNGVWVPIDNYFDVKGVGTVILGVVRGGAVKKHDTLKLQPSGKDAVIKGIQSQDRDLEEAGIGTRVGLNLKGTSVDDLRRGYVLCNDCVVSKNPKLEFVRLKFTKEVLEPGTQVFLSVGLQVIQAKVESVSPFSLQLDQPAAYFAGERAIIASAKNALPRIIGSGKML